MKITYSIQSTSRSRMEFRIDSTAKAELKSICPSAYSIPARNGPGFLVICTDYVAGFGLTVDEAYGDALYSVKNALLTHAQIFDGEVAHA